MISTISHGLAFYFLFFVISYTSIHHIVFICLMFPSYVLIDPVDPDPPPPIQPGNVSKMHLEPQLRNLSIPPLPVQHAEPFQAPEHPRVANIVHGAPDRARIDRHVRPAHKEAAHDGQPHDAQDTDSQPVAHARGEPRLRHAKWHITQQHRHELG